MYLIWRPALSNAIFVPLGVANWAWSANATFSTSTSKWSLGAHSGPTYSAGPTSSYPSWAQTVAKNGSICGQPYDAQQLESITGGPYRRRPNR